MGAALAGWAAPNRPAYREENVCELACLAEAEGNPMPARRFSRGVAPLGQI